MRSGGAGREESRVDATAGAGLASTNGLEPFLARHRRLFVLTGAGCSTDSGLPDYRDENGDWKRPQPVTYQAFMRDRLVRQRYWARSLIGWRRFSFVQPNEAHHALANLEAAGGCTLLLTQNVDGLHQAAGSRNVIDLHGRLDRVFCLSCGTPMHRDALQALLVARNPDWAALDAAVGPDGDADLAGRDFARFEEAPCPVCGGLLKPDVVFFGENTPRERVERAMGALRDADAMLVVGSSLMVYSGFRFARAAADLGRPIAAINLGRTRADDLLTLKIARPCAEALAFLL